MALPARRGIVAEVSNKRGKFPASRASIKLDEVGAQKYSSKQGTGQTLASPRAGCYRRSPRATTSDLVWGSHYFRLCAVSYVV